MGVEKPRKGGSFLKYFRGKPGNNDAKEGEGGEKKESEVEEEPGNDGQPPSEDNGEQEGKSPSAFRLKKDWSREAKVLNKIKTSAAG